MKILTCAASLLALSLFAGPVLAQDATTTEQPAAEQGAAQLPEAVLALLNDKRSAQELSDDELKGRLKQVRRAIKLDGVPDDAKSQLQAMADADKAELETRAQAKSQEAPAQPAQEQAAPAQEQAAPVQEQAAPAQEQAAPAQTEQPVEQAAPEPVKKKKKDAAATQEQQPAQQDASPAELPADVAALLAETRAVEDIPVDELRARAKSARQFSRDQNLPEDVRGKLAAIAKEARTAMMAREQQPAEEPAPAQTTEQPTTQPPVQEQAQQPAAPAVVTEPPPADAQATAPAAQPAAPAVDKVQAKALDGNVGNPEAEAKAKAYIADQTDINGLKDDELRTRLDGIRDLLAENELSSETERALRTKLRGEREVLRARVAKVKAEEEAKAAAELAAKAQQQQQATAPAQNGTTAPAPDKKKPKFNLNFNILITPDTPRREILRDRRPSDELAPEELRRRIRAYREVETDQAYLDYDPGLRDYWRSTQRRDRELLRQRMMDERAMRRASLDDEDNIDIQDEYVDGEEDMPEDVFAAEVDEGDIEKALVAPPRKKIQRRYTIEDIATQPQLRQAMTRIEVDTIRFGFNEAFVREEEVDNLDQIASVIERVLKKRPGEVFLIEGHTDAVGSDAYNLKLSKARAEAVKRALSSFYVIPERNLQTVGLGERYLKIPTADQEPENRRVSISRATPLVGELQD